MNMYKLHLSHDAPYAWKIFSVGAANIGMRLEINNDVLG